MNDSDGHLHRFRILSDEEFQTLSAQERVEYLRRAALALEQLKQQVRDSEGVPVTRKP